MLKKEKDEPWPPRKGCFSLSLWWTYPPDLFTIRPLFLFFLLLSRLTCRRRGWVCMLPCHHPFQVASPHLIMDCILFPRTLIKGQFKGNSSSTLKCLIKQCSLLAFCTGYLLHCCNKIPEHSNLTKEGFLGSLCGWRRHSSKSVRQLVTLH